MKLGNLTPKARFLGFIKAQEDLTIIKLILLEQLGRV